MKEYYSPSRRVFLVFLGLFFLLLCLMCLVPFLHVLALSFSHKTPATKYLVRLLPLDFNADTKVIHLGVNLQSYLFVLTKPEFITSLWVSFQRIILSGIFTMVTVIFAAYPLTKSNYEFRGRTVYTWIFVLDLPPNPCTNFRVS